MARSNKPRFKIGDRVGVRWSMWTDPPRWKTGTIVYVGPCYRIERVQAIVPKVHVFGHIHEGHGTIHPARDCGYTIFVNASICDERYMTSNKPIIVNGPRAMMVLNIRA